MTKKSKMLVALLLVLVMVLTTACSSGEEVKQPASVNGDSSVTSGDTPAENNTNTEEEDTAVEITVAETVLYDAGDIKVTATGYEDGWMGPEIKVLVENNSTKNVLVTADAVSVNGYMMPYASLYAEVAEGKKANESLSIMSSELDQSGIEVVAEMQFYIQISDSETWETMATSELLTLTTSAAPYEQSVDDSGDVLYDSEGIRIICKGLKQDIIWDGTVVFYMENNSGKAISIYAENVSVNGFMQDVGLWSDLRPGTKLIDGMSMIDLSDLEIENIDQIKNIEFNLRVVDANTWEDIKTTDVLTLNFE
jgi:hypothetical protein